jgi:hypothetical protein
MERKMMARSSKRPKRPGKWEPQIAQLKLRLPESLRRQIESAARISGHSMNTEIVRRLGDSFRNYDTTHRLAVALLNDLDSKIVNEMVEIVLYDREEADKADKAHEALKAQAGRPQESYWDAFAVPPEQRRRHLSSGSVSSEPPLPNPVHFRTRHPSIKDGDK